MSCPHCSATPYRNADVRPPVPPKKGPSLLSRTISSLFSTMGPWLGNFILGGLTIVLVLVACWMATVGSQRFGHFLGMHVFNVDMATDWDPSPKPFFTWLLGFCAIFGVFFFPGIGRRTLKWMKKR